MSNSESDIAVMDQFVVSRQAADMMGPKTPLAHVGLPARTIKSSIASIVDSKAVAAKGESSVLLEEAAVTGILILRASAAREELSMALQGILQFALPERLQSHVANGGYCVRWMSPDEWMLSCPVEEAFSIEQQLRSAVKGPVAIVNVSGGYSLLTLSGPDAVNVLKKSSSYNLNPENFPPNKVVNTVLAKAQVTLRAVGEEHYELLVRRSFADYVWLWLQRAGKEYGLQGVAASA